jgi:hypothetical protein
MRQAQLKEGVVCTVDQLPQVSVTSNAIPELTRSSLNKGSGAAQTGRDGREAFAGTGAVPGQERQMQRDPGFASTQEGKGYDQGAQERSRPVDTHQDRGQGATDDRSQQRSEQPSQQMAGEQPTTGQIQHESLQQEGQQGIQKGTGEGQRGQMNFQGIPQDD